MNQNMTAEQTADKSRRHTGKRLGLDVGMRMSLSLLHEDGEGRITAELVGLVHFEYLVLRLPWIPGLRTRLVAGAVVTVRFISDGVLCGFQSEIITHVGKPSLLLFVIYPDVVEKLSIRQHKRIQCALPAQLHSSRGDAKGLLANISQGGCRMLLDARKQTELRQSVAGDELVLRFHLEADSIAKAAKCDVRSVNADSSRIVLGISFTGKDPEFIVALQSFLEQASMLGED